MDTKPDEKTVSIKQAAWAWITDNLEATPPIMLLTEPPRYYPHPEKAFAAGYEFAKKEMMNVWDDAFEAGKQFYLKMADEGR